MTLFTNVRQQRRSAFLLGVVVFAWLGITTTPCAMALSTDTVAAETVSVVASHNACPHASVTKSTSEAECCCNLIVAPIVDEQQIPKPNAQLVFAVDLYLLDPVFAEHRPFVRPSTFPALARSKPIYLSTQRLRL